MAETFVDKLKEMGYETIFLDIDTYVVYNIKRREQIAYGISPEDAYNAYKELYLI